MADTSRFNLSLPGATIRNILTLSNKVFTAGSELTNAEKELIRNNLGITSSGETEALTEVVKQNTAKIDNLITVYLTKVAELEAAIASLNKRIAALEGGVETFEITFIYKNEDGTEQQSKTSYCRGDKVVPPAIPTEAVDNTYTYTFKGWDKEVVDCAGDATYTATYDATFINYIIVFKDENGDILSSNTYYYGDDVTVPTAPTKEGYTFAGWDPAVDETVSGNAIYTAQYTKTPSVNPDEPDEPDEPEIPEFAQAFVNNIPTSNMGTTFTELDSLSITDGDSIGYYIDTENNRIILQDNVEETGRGVKYSLELSPEIVDNYTFTVWEFDALANPAQWTYSPGSITPEISGTTCIFKTLSGSYVSRAVQIRLVFIKKEN